MAGKNKITLEFDGLEKMLEKLEKQQKSIKKATENALRASEKVTQGKIEKVFVKSRMPAKGVYATLKTERSILHNSPITWEGSVASVNIGFDFEKSGLTSIYLMYGTPKMKPVTGLKAAIYGKKAKEERAEAQRQAFNNILDKVEK